MSTNGFIYAIGVDGSTYVKIGYTRSSVHARLKQLQTGQASPLHIVAAIPIEKHMRRIEKQIHAFLASERQHGEWFDIPMDSEQLQALILRAVAYVEQLPLPSPRSHKERSSNGLGVRVKQRRLELGWTQSRLADAIGMTQGLLSQLEKGDVEDIQSRRLKAIAQTLDVSMDWLLELEPARR